MSTTLWRHARIATMDGARPWGWIEHGALLAEGQHIAWVGNDAQLPAGLGQPHEVDLQGALVTPGLIDAHTHLVYGGDRAAEFELRLQGASYEEIARQGGGIASTVSATRAASDELLFAGARQRALALMAEGVTTLEIKSGYGLSQQHEARCLGVARRLGRELRAHRAHDLAVRARPATRVRRPRRRLHRRRLPVGWPTSMRAAWSTPSMPSATRSASRRRRRAASSTPRSAWACRSSCTPSNCPTSTARHSRRATAL